MIYCFLPGIAAFVLFGIYEIHAATGRFSWLKPLFFIGVAMIFFSACAGAAATVAAVGIRAWRAAVFGILALIFLLLLVYSLFCAVPFSNTYIVSDKKQKKVCKSGMYALCRHPGVLWFAGFYLFFWLALGGELLRAQFLTYSGLNLVYILIQDRWSFPRCFADYDDYKENTPFLIPNLKSIKRCIETFK